MKTKLISLLLLISLLAAGAASCAGEISGGAVSSGSDGTAAVTTSAVTEETTTTLTDNLPAKNYNGEDYSMLVRTERLYYLTAEESTGDTLNDAVFARNRTVEERFNVKLKFKDVKSDKTLFTNAVSSSVLSGDGAYDLIVPDYLWQLDTGGFFMDLGGVDYLDFERPWWSSSWNKNVEIMGKRFTGVGYHCLDLLRNVEVVYFNKGMIGDFKLDDPYKLTNDGKWTLDRAREMGKAVSRDVDGNGAFDDKDSFGIYTNIHSFRGLYFSSGINPAEYNSPTDYKLTLISDKFVKLYEIIYDMRNSDVSALYRADSTVDFTTTLAYAPFTGNRLLFTFFALTAVEAMRSTETDFGIIPVPKFDEKQENYITHNYGCTVSAIPVTAKNTEKSAIVLEALNFESYMQVSPVYYDKVLKSKLTRDNESEAMLDMIFGNIEFCFGFIYNAQIGGPVSLFYQDKNKDIASAYAANEAKYKTAFDELIKKYAEL